MGRVYYGPGRWKSRGRGTFLGGENIADTGVGKFKGVLIGLVLLIIGAGFASTAAADPAIANDTLLTLVVGFVPVALGVGVLIQAFRSF